MKFFLCVLGMVMVVEGLPYFAFPEKMKNWVQKILEITKYKPRIVYDTTKPVGVISRSLDITKSKKLLDWEPQVSLEEGLTRTINWFKKTRPKSVETIN